MIFDEITLEDIIEARAEEAAEMAAAEATAKATAEGLKAGRAEIQVEIAKKSIEAGLDFETISRITGLSVDEIKKLK